jgi:hypothetical protein
VDTSLTDESRESVYNHTEAEKWVTLRTRQSIDYIGRIKAAHSKGVLTSGRACILAAGTA